ncbi:hypothetical protein ACFX2I_038912 [Malus domestica]
MKPKEQGRDSYQFQGVWWPKLAGKWPGRAGFSPEYGENLLEAFLRSFHVQNTYIRSEMNHGSQRERFKGFSKLTYIGGDGELTEVREQWPLPRLVPKFLVLGSW